jgi:hypothetical protein
VIWGATPEQVFANLNVPADFSRDPAIRGKLRYARRVTKDGHELDFVANKIEAVVQEACVLRAATGHPEFWWPQTGQSEPVEFNTHSVPLKTKGNSIERCTVGLTRTQ